MRSADRRGDSITSGQMNTYFSRTSVFTIVMRPAGRDENGAEYTWEPIGEQFAVKGSSPVDQYNYLRIIHAQTREYEYKFVPKNGADLAAFSPDEEIFWLLDSSIANYAGQGVNVSGTYSNKYGTFILQASGRQALKGELEFAPELTTGLQTNTGDQPLINAVVSLHR